VYVEEGDGPSPRESRGRRVVMRRRIVVETMLSARVSVRLVLDARRFECGFVPGPCALMLSSFSAKWNIIDARMLDTSTSFGAPP
jgi:hypothetical protein